MKLVLLAAAAFIAASTVAWIRFRHQHIWGSGAVDDPADPEFMTETCVVCGTHDYGSLLEDEDGLPPLFI